jgi:HEAT repeat protein
MDECSQELKNDRRAVIIQLMPQKRYLLRVVLPATLVLCGFAAFYVRPRIEPVYKNETLSDWLCKYQSPITSADAEAADEAIRHIGTNAIPFLLQRLRSEDPPRVDHLVGIANLKLNIKTTAAGPYRGEGAEGFRVLGASASNSVPELIKTYDDLPNDLGRWETIRSIAFIGLAARNEATPFLLRVVREGGCYTYEMPATVNTDTRSPAIEALQKVDADRALVIPALADLLTNSDWRKKVAAAHGLADYGMNARSALPALTNMLSDPDTNVVAKARDAINKITGEK